MKNTYGDLLDRDYSEIDSELLGKSTLDRDTIAAPNDSIAPAQGYPFFDKIKSLVDMLKRFDVIYRL